LRGGKGKESLRGERGLTASEERERELERRERGVRRKEREQCLREACAGEGEREREG